MLVALFSRKNERVRHVHMKGIRTRHAVRALIVSDSDEILLLRMEHPEDGDDFWLLPGGGIKSNEDPAIALRREVWEETGLKLTNAPALIWRRTHRFERGFESAATPVDQYEQIYLVRSRRFEPTEDNNPDPSKVGVFHEFHWWTIAELIEAKSAIFAPRSLPLLVQQLVVEGPPSTPVTLDD